MSDSEYYVLKCPYCDENITSIIENPKSWFRCIHCDKELSLYSVFGYNMWLAENNRCKKVKRKPIKDVISSSKAEIRPKEISIEFHFDEDNYEYDEEAIKEDYLRQSSLMQKRPMAMHEILSFNADICSMQLAYLMKLGFTREESIELIKKLIDQDFIL